MRKNRRNKFFSMKGLVMILLALLLLPALSLLRSTASEPSLEVIEEENPSAVRITIVEAERRPVIRAGLTSSATLEAKESVVLYAKVSGRLQEMPVSQGDIVKQGAVVAVIDHRDQDAQEKALEAQVNAAKAAAEQARAQLESATKEKERYERLLKESYSTQQELDNRVTTYQSAKAAYNQSLATVKQQEANLSAQKVAKSEYILLSPMDGVVLKDFSLVPGTMISTSTSIAEIGDMRTMKGIVQLSELQANKVSKGMKTIITGDGFPGLEFEGEVSRISPYVDTSTRTLQVEFMTDNNPSGGRLKPGMFVSVLFVEVESHDTLVIPSNALRDDNRVLVENDGVAKEKTVETGLIFSDIVQIISGLEEGERVIAGGKSLKDGDRVIVDK